MADYSGRTEEINQQLRMSIQSENRLKIHDETLKLFDLNFLNTLHVIEVYGEMRELAFVEGLKLITPGSTDTAEVQQQRWNEHFGKVCTKASELFDDAADAASDYDHPIETLLGIMVLVEGYVWSTIANMKIAEATGQVRAHILQLKQDTVKLDNIWNELTNQIARMDGQIAGVRELVLKYYKQELSNIRGWASKIESGLGIAAASWAANEGADPEPGLSATLADVTLSVMTTIQSLQHTHEEARRNSFGLYAEKQSIHQVFGNTRLQLNDYFTKVNEYTVLREHAVLCNAAKEAASKFTSVGLRKDAELFVSRAVTASEAVVNEFNIELKLFYEHFLGRFTGNVSDTNAEMLAEEEFFNRFWHELEAANLPGEFSIALEAIARCENISLDRLTEAQKVKFRQIIQARLKEIQAPIRNMDMSIFQRVKLIYYDIPLDQIKDKVKRLPGYSK